jgi:hypothetical protein
VTLQAIQVMYPKMLTGMISLCTKSGVDLKSPYSNPPLAPLAPLFGLWQGLLSGTWDLHAQRDCKKGHRATYVH